MSGVTNRATLLHVCCGPCSLVPVRTLREQGEEVVGLFHNPNIHGVEEYFKRREAVLQAAQEMDCPMICLDAEYDPRRFFQVVHGREDHRCPACYRLRLERTFAYAKEHGFSAVSTTLLYSIYQDRDAILAIGRELDDRTGIRFLDRDFRPGWQAGIDLSRQWGLYRQSYCGCLYSELERRRKKLNRLADGSSPT
ncbi:epoxyqueuosine reductase QueH [Desulfonatronum lacustre]|uniref:epoxyqueuosine reductase QueH n=1 Tax=Desulfonatronum lacustre TaxID=66849 RepID=UPI00048F138F|nr:epoxyqueuosine reductase QueH [Desulfonatronum lacustre]